MLSEKHSHERDKNIQFYEENHIYVIAGLKESPISVTTVIHEYFPKFDSDKIIDKMMTSYKWKESKYYGMSKSDIKEKWEKDRNLAAAQGTLMHKSIEDYINEGKTPLISTREFEYFLRFWTGLKNGSPLCYPYRTEWYIYDEDVKIAGSIDFVLADELGQLIIFDWKRSKEIKMNNQYQTGTGILSHLDDCNFNHYSIQLNCYRYILEKKYNKKVRNMFLVILHPDNEDFILLQVPSLKTEIEAIWKERSVVANSC